jgi:hypothetical protein
MGFIDFLLKVGKTGIGIVGGFILIMTGFLSFAEPNVPTLVAGLILVLGIVLGLYGVYNLRHLDRQSY